MLEKYFVPSDRALKLKELGFDEVCLKLYVDGELGGSLRPWDYQHSKNKNILCAPLFCQAFDWFREKCWLYSQTPSTCIDEDDRIFYNNPIYDELDNIVFESMEQYKTYEEAELACLDKLIEIVQNNEKI